MHSGQIYRVTFSRSVAEHIARIHSKPLCVVRLQLRLGRRLAPGEVSRTGLYAIVSTRKSTILRVTLFQALAEGWRDVSRDVYECFANVVDNPSPIAISTTLPPSTVRRSTSMLNVQAARPRRGAKPKGILHALS